MSITQAPPSARPARLVVIGPRDSPRLLDKVAEALRQRGHSVLVPSTDGRKFWRDQWVKTYNRSLGPGTAVVVVPRPDGSIGQGTAVDVHRARYTSGVRVAVVRPDGKLVPIVEAGLEELPEGQRSEKRWARFTWPTWPKENDQ